MPLNLRLTEGTDTSSIVKAIEYLRPTTFHLPITVPSLSTIPALIPTVSLDDGTMSRGSLQLCPGTHVLLDECSLGEGGFCERGTAALKAVMELLDHQSYSVDFGYQTVQFSTDYPVLGLSHGKSIFSSYPWSVEVKEVNFSSTSVSEKIMDEWRQYLEEARSCPITIPAPISARLETEYTAIRQAMGAGKFDENQFSRVLNLAKILGKTHMAQEMGWEHWEEAMDLYRAYM